MGTDREVQGEGHDGAEQGRKRFLKLAMNRRIVRVTAFVATLLSIILVSSAGVRPF